MCYIPVTCHVHVDLDSRSIDEKNQHWRATLSSFVRPPSVLLENVPRLAPASVAKRLPCLSVFGNQSAIIFGPGKLARLARVNRPAS